MTVRERTDALKLEYHKAAERARESGCFVWACRFMTEEPTYGSAPYEEQKEFDEAVKLAYAELQTEDFTEYLSHDHR